MKLSFAPVTRIPGKPSFECMTYNNLSRKKAEQIIQMYRSLFDTPSAWKITALCASYTFRYEEIVEDAPCMRKLVLDDETIGSDGRTIHFRTELKDGERTYHRITVRKEYL